MDLGYYQTAQGRKPVIEWLRDLSPRERKYCVAAITRLTELGRKLGMPHSRPLRGHPELYELRTRAGSTPLRVIYQFWPSPRGEVVVLLEGVRKTSEGKQAQAILRAAERSRDLRLDAGRHLSLEPPHLNGGVR